MLQDIIKLQKKIIPELVELLEKRYLILRTISYNQPVGRRVLANKVDLGERIVRTEINFLKNQGLIEINTPGMTVTEEGENILDSLKDFIHEVKGLSKVEVEIKKILNIKEVIVIPGSVEEDKNILQDLGKAASQYTKKIIKSGDIVAITGGSTVKEVVDSFPKLQNLHDVLVVPARGGMGKKVETQANTLCATLAQKLNGSYKMLHIPENISSELMQSLFNQSDIKEVFDLIRKANLLIYGIGRADKMVLKRGISDEKQKELIELGAIGEAVGCYFDKNSNVVSISSAPGISIKELSEAREHIAVAGGKGKVEAIISALYNNNKAVLVTDEAAAEEIIKNMKH
ncbi:sugar-binding transcriptional regulator [Clostridium massiliamazoniense]|uniref:sugar-binding transcriptional regulator n=1 Tax=Clostridium massiliamazoniense TaxID=1347366 RepID=UPI000A409D43|nr:sugar-binding domain-containing protein [Clostridium massiliamazoniense]